MPKDSTVKSIIAFTSSCLAILTAKALAVPPEALISSAVAEAVSIDMSATMTLAPSAASFKAIPLPRPRPAPVTIAVLFSSLMINPP